MPKAMETKEKEGDQKGKEGGPNGKGKSKDQKGKGVATCYRLRLETKAAGKQSQEDSMH